MSRKSQAWRALKKLGACPEAVEWMRSNRTLSDDELWRCCTYAPWLLWAASFGLRSPDSRHRELVAETIRACALPTLRSLAVPYADIAKGLYMLEHMQDRDAALAVLGIVDDRTMHSSALRCIRAPVLARQVAEDRCSWSTNAPSTPVSVAFAACGTAATNRLCCDIIKANITAKQVSDWASGERRIRR